MNRATSRALGRVRAFDNGCSNNAGGYHVTRAINNHEVRMLTRQGLTLAQLERYVMCRMCGRMGPPELLRTSPLEGP